jgi:predicted Zn-dependent peptidase
MVENINFHLYKSNNNLKLLLIPTKNTNIITIGFFIQIGSINENNDELGIAHFLEHMMFKGSKHYPSLFNKLDELGATYNAETSMETTNYIIHGLNKYINELLFILFDMYYNPLISEEFINIEKKIILQEMKMKLDELEYKLYINLLKIITKYQHTNYNKHPIGTKKSIENITYNKLKKFRKKYYNENNTLITIYGNFKLLDIIKKIEYINSKIIKKNIKFKLINYNPNNNNNNFIEYTNNIIKLKDRYIYEIINVNQYNVIISFPCWKKFTKNYYILTILISILSDGMSGRLFHKLREHSGLTYSINTNIDYYDKFGIFNISITVNEIFKSIMFILTELINLYNNGITKDELNKSININLTKYMIFFQNNINIFNYLIEKVAYNQIINNPQDIINIYNNININDLNNIIKELFNPKYMYISIIGPKKISTIKIKQLFNYFHKHIYKNNLFN